VRGLGCLWSPVRWLEQVTKVITLFRGEVDRVPSDNNGILWLPHRSWYNLSNTLNKRLWGHDMQLGFLCARQGWIWVLLLYAGFDVKCLNWLVGSCSDWLWFFEPCCSICRGFWSHTVRRTTPTWLFFVSHQLMQRLIRLYRGQWSNFDRFLNCHAIWGVRRL
jgi:hypothetical protein